MLTVLTVGVVKVVEEAVVAVDTDSVVPVVATVVPAVDSDSLMNVVGVVVLSETHTYTHTYAYNKCANTTREYCLYLHINYIH